MKITNVKLLYSSGVHFESFERYEDGLIGELKKNGKSSFDALMWAWTRCAEAAELLRRYYDQEPRKILTEAEWRLIITPKQLKTVTEMVIAAVNHGMTSEDAEEDQDIDLTLVEFQKKTSDD